jgi:plasmid stability protein
MDGKGETMKAMLIRHVPEPVHRALKMQAAAKGVTLHNLCVQILSEATQEKKKDKAA